MPQNFFQHAHIHLPALIHQGRGGMAQLMHGELSVGKAGGIEIFINDPLHGFGADALPAAALSVWLADSLTLLSILVSCSISILIIFCLYP